MSSVILLAAVGLAVGGGVAELETGGGFVHGLSAGDQVDNDIHVVHVVIIADVFIHGQNIRELVFQAGEVELGIKQLFFFFIIK